MPPKRRSPPRHKASNARPPPSTPSDPSQSSTSFPRRPLVLVRGLRPTFFPLKNPEEMYTMSIDTLDLGDAVHLKEFDDGTLEGLRKWNAEHEALVEWLYDPRGRCLVDPRYPYEHSHSLTEYCCAVRKRGKEALAHNADSISNLLNSDSFKEKVIDTWLALTQSEQEKLLLEALSQLDKSDPPGSECFARSRKLLPEIIVADLLSDGGGGLVKLFEDLAVRIPEGTELPEHPLFNENFFKKFGISMEGHELPLSMADRAFQQEYLMRRHSLLFTVIEYFVRQIIGKPHPKNRVGIANYRSEVTRSNDPELADKPSSIDDETLTKNFQWLVDECCNNCSKTAAQAGLKALLYCESCKKVDRIEPYCSSYCQKRDWKSHKQNHCGSRTSTFDEVPIIRPQSASTSPSATAHLPRLRRSIRRLLDTPTYRDEFFTFESGSSGIGFLAQEDPKQTVRVRQAMRGLAFKALETADQTSVGLLALCLFNVEFRTQSLITKGKKKKLGPTNFSRDDAQEREVEFRRIFEINDDEVWKATLEKGKEAIVRAGNEVIMEFYDTLLDQAIRQRDDIIEAMGGSESSGMPEGMIKFKRMMFSAMLGPLERFPLEQFSKPKE